MLGISKIDSLPTQSDRNAVCLSFAYHIYLVCGWSNVFGKILPSYWLDVPAWLLCGIVFEILSFY